MNRSRRLWLLLPLVGLTLLLAPLGWRNWHLSMSEEDVWAEIPAEYLSSGVLAWRHAGFAPNSTTVFGLERTPTQAKPVSRRLFARLRQLYPISPIVNAPQPIKKFNNHFRFGPVLFKDRFSAQCRVSYITRASSQAVALTMSETFHFKRSPVNLRDSDWYLYSWGNFSMHQGPH